MESDGRSEGKGDPRPLDKTNGAASKSKVNSIGQRIDMLEVNPDRPDKITTFIPVTVGEGGNPSMPAYRHYKTCSALSHCDEFDLIYPEAVRLVKLRIPATKNLSARSRGNKVLEVAVEKATDFDAILCETQFSTG
ncbi:hypothetical protein BZG36_00127 [Bifiguratus adelaidae]|uniref:Uncharacterized protein n=1 Tax=Bifiguratus adelaidae TaxID=1938954 RepID=A0A261Y884_9FUNG|nr:hypothetical protein BZG36_00127 [Bifiguratus adelaidae]